MTPVSLNVTLQMTSHRFFNIIRKQSVRVKNGKLQSHQRKKRKNEQVKN